MIQETKYILESIAEFYKDGSNYYILNGGDNKVWLLPLANVRRGMEIYTASSLKGVILKILLPWTIKIPFVQWFLSIEKIHLSLKQDVQSVLDGICSEPVLSMYMGNAMYPQNRKVIVQIANNSKVLGYAKFGLEEIILVTFCKEVNTLKLLEHKGIQGIPRVLWSGKVGQVEGFIQSTNRKGGEQTIYTLKNEHWDFLKKLKDATRKEVDYASSSYSNIMHSFGETLIDTEWRCKDMLLGCIERIDRHYTEHKFLVCFSHGDFTPWNVCYNKGDLFVFDFEYAQEDFPIAMDVFHYVTQVGILVKNADAEEIFQDVMNYSGQLKEFVEDIKFSYIQYLLYIIAFYYNRMGNQLSEDERSCKIWIKLIELCFIDGLKKERS